jgi:eukaryotic-like serine/threonine-protein kinase
MGTPSYMAPEQAGGKAIGPLCDVYALGAILYECLTGRPPFRAATDMETLMQVVSDEPVPPRQLQSKTPRDLETICLKCLNKEPARRYESAAALADDLGRWQRGEPVRARPPSLAYLLGKQLRRHRVPVTAAAVVLLATVIGVVVSFLQISAALEQEKEAKGEAQDREQKLKATLAEKETLLSEGARAYCELSDREFRNKNVPGSLNWLLRAYEVAPADDPLRPSYRHLLAARARSLERLLVHGDKVAAVAFSPDSTRVLTGSADRTARLWDAATGQPLGEPLRHEGAVNGVAFSPDGKRLLTASDGTARWWDAASGQPLGEALHCENTICTVALSPDGRRLLTASEALGLDGRLLTPPFDGTVRLWDAASGQPLGEPLRHKGVPWAPSVVFSPDGRRVLAGGDKYTAGLWDAASGEQLQVLRHNGPVVSVAFSPDGRTALTGSMDGAARLWDTATGQQLHLLPHATKGEPEERDKFPTDIWVGVAAFSPDGRTVITGGMNKLARLWDVATGQPRGEPLRHQKEVCAAAFSPDGRAVLTGSGDGTVRLWDAANGQQLADLPGHDQWVSAVAFSPDGRRVLTGSGDGTARLWDLAAGAPLGQPFRDAKGSEVPAVAFSPDGRKLLLVGYLSNVVRVWDVASRQLLGQPFRPDKQVVQVAFSPDGRSVLTVCGDARGQLWDAALWDAASGQRLHVLHAKDHVFRAVFSPDGRRVLTAQRDGTTQLWDAASGQPLGEPLRHDRAGGAAAFSPDATRLLAGFLDGTVRLWDIASGEPLGEALRHQDMVRAAAFSPDGRRVLTACEKTARLWDAATGQPLGEPLRHDQWVKAVAFSPDGRSVLTGTAGDSLKLRPSVLQLWDVATGKPLGESLYRGGWMDVNAVAFSPDGRTVLAAIGDAAVLWEVVAPAPDEPARLRAWVAVRTGKLFDDRGILRPLPQAEWLQHWQELNTNGGDWEPQPDDRAWHLFRADDAEFTQRWFAAAFHLNWLPKIDPDNANLRSRRDNAETHLKR